MNRAGSDPDASLVHRLQDGDNAAFAEIYELYKGKVYNTAFRITTNAADAADVTQEIFINIFKKIRLFRFESKFSTWVYRMSVNTSIDRYRKRTRHPTVSTDDEAFRQTKQFRGLADDSAPSGAQTASKREVDADIQKTIDLLPVKLRAAVVLRYVQDLSYEEVAAAMGCSQGTIKSRLNRAHARLHKMLKEVL